MKKILLACLAALALQGMAPARAADNPVSLGVVVWVGYGPIYCAAAQGLYKKYGLDVKLVTFSDNSMMAGALQGGEVTATTLTYDQVVTAVAKGWPLKVIMPVDYSVGGDAILATDALTAIKQIKGHKVAVTPASPSDFLLAYALAKDGLSERDIQTVNTTPEGVVGIMVGGSADVGVTYEPSVSTIAKAGGGKRFHVLMSSKEARGMITDVLVMKDTVIAKNPKIAEGLIRGTLDGLDFMRKEPAKAAAIIGKVLDISADEVMAQLPLIENPPLAELGDVFKKSDSLPSFFASGKIITDILKQEGQIDRAPALDSTFDASFVTHLQSNPGE